ncbi:unnamed protein product [Agarophyton chilense]
MPERIRRQDLRIGLIIRDRESCPVATSEGIKALESLEVMGGTEVNEMNETVRNACDENSSNFNTAETLLMPDVNEEVGIEEIPRTPVLYLGNAARTLFHCIDRRFSHFMHRHLWMIGYSVKHHVTLSAINDLLHHHCCDDRTKLRFTTWEGVNIAVKRNSYLETSLHPCCELGHEALRFKAEGILHTCSQVEKKDKEVPGKDHGFKTVEYLKIWPRLQAMLQSKVYGPLLYDYYQASLREIGDGYYSDFVSGSNFRKIEEMMGGREKIMNDMFVNLSTDGIDVFRSNQNSIWPVVLSLQTCLLVSDIRETFFYQSCSYLAPSHRQI